MLVRLDSNDFVIGVEREKREMPTTRTQICKGPWHYQRGKGTPLPLDKFIDGNRTCIECREKHEASRQRAAKARGEITPPATREERMEDLNNGVVSTLQGGAMHKWKVTVLRPVEEVVYAKTYVEAGAEVETGQVLRVERLD